ISCQPVIPRSFAICARRRLLQSLSASAVIRYHSDTPASSPGPSRAVVVLHATIIREWTDPENSMHPGLRRAQLVVRQPPSPSIATLRLYPPRPRSPLAALPGNQKGGPSTRLRRSRPPPSMGSGWTVHARLTSWRVPGLGGPTGRGTSCQRFSPLPFGSLGRRYHIGSNSVNRRVPGLCSKMDTGCQVGPPPSAAFCQPRAAAPPASRNPRRSRTQRRCDRLCEKFLEPGG